MSINREFVNKAVIWLAVIGYLVVNIRMQFNFFAGRNIFEKYRVAADTAQALSIAQQAYYAKTGWLPALADIAEQQTAVRTRIRLVLRRIRDDHDCVLRI